MRLSQDLIMCPILLDGDTTMMVFFLSTWLTIELSGVVLMVIQFVGGIYGKR